MEITVEMRAKMFIEKGSQGYINKRKKNALIWTIIMAVLGVAVFVTGLLLNDMSKRNIFTVIAVLFVLPGAKFLVRFIVTFPYHSVEESRYNKVKSNISEGMELYTDMIITSPDKVMNLDFIAVGNKQVIGLIGKEKQDIAYIRKYISDGVANWGSGYKVKIVESENRVISELNAVSMQEVDGEEEDNVKSYIKSLIV